MFGCAWCVFENVPGVDDEWVTAASVSVGWTLVVVACTALAVPYDRLQAMLARHDIVVTVLEHFAALPGNHCTV